MENCGIEKSDHITTWKLYILPMSACHSQINLSRGNRNTG